MQPAMAICWPCPVVLTAFLVGRVSGLVDRSPSGPGLPEPIVEGPAIQLSGSRRCPPIMPDATGRACDSVWLTERGLADGLQTAHWPLDGPRFQAPRQGSHLPSAPGQGTLGALGRPLLLGFPSPQSHCWSKRE